MTNITWTKEDFNKVIISDMSDSHLTNTYRMLERKGEGNRYIYKEMLKRGFTAETEMEDAWDWEMVSNYDGPPF